MDTLELKELNVYEMQQVNGGGGKLKLFQKIFEYVTGAATLHDAMQELSSGFNECKNF